jgi:hypothetical protein
MKTLRTLSLMTVMIGLHLTVMVLALIGMTLTLIAIFH